MRISTPAKVLIHLIAVAAEIIGAELLEKVSDISIRIYKKVVYKLMSGQSICPGAWADHSRYESRIWC